MQAGAKVSAFRVPDQALGCAGGRQRNPATGGAAYGTPLYTVKPCAWTPDNSPDAVVIDSAPPRPAAKIIAAHAVTTETLARARRDRTLSPSAACRRVHGERRRGN